MGAWGHGVRRWDWERRLSEFIGRADGFEWGRSDCALFVGSAIAAMTGKDPASPVRGKYASERGAYRQHKGNLGDFAGGLLEGAGCVEIPPLKARRGDAVVFNTELGETLGVVSLDNRIVAMGLEGPEFFRYGMQHRAWRVD